MNKIRKRSSTAEKTSRVEFFSAVLFFLGAGMLRKNALPQINRYSEEDVKSIDKRSGFPYT